MSEQTVSTPYGVLDRASLLKAQQSFDTRALLQMVEALDRSSSEPESKMACATNCSNCIG